MEFKSFGKILHIGKLHMSITQKIHGCFSSDTWITMADASRKHIKEIVESNKDEYVMGYKDGILYPCKVINKFNNGLTNDWITIQITNNGHDRHKNPRNIHVTPNHNFYVIDKGYKKAIDLNADDRLLYIKPKIELTFLQEQILTGIMLGDGHLSKNYISFGHKIEHVEYLEYIIKSLTYISGNQQKNQTSGYGTIMCRARTKSLECIESIFSKWIINDGKHIPNEINLTPISMAFWYMDDGSLCHYDKQEDRLTLATNAFNHDDLAILIKQLLKFGIICKMQNSNGLIIRLNKKEADKFFTLICPYIPEVMQYKLPKRYRGLFNFKIPDETVQYEKPLLEQKVIKVYKKQLRTSDKNKYDLETETHNYFADGVLVHNSNAQILIEEPSGGGWIAEGYGYKSYTIHAGSRTRWLTHNDDNYGFCKWVMDNRQEIIEKLGPGRHFGEWAGPGINSNEGLKEKTLCLFNWRRFGDKVLPENITTVPLLYAGKISLNAINEAMHKLKEQGSMLVPGFMKPEGVVIEIDGQLYKNVFDPEEVEWTKTEKTVKAKKPRVDISYLFQPLRLQKLLSKDESYIRNYPSSLGNICKDYVDDLEDEKQFKSANEDELKLEKKELGRQIYFFVKSIVNAII